MKRKSYADGGKATRRGPKTETPREGTVTRDGDTVRVEPGSTRSNLRNQRQRQMEALGLKDGGRVSLPPPQRGRTPRRITTPGPPGGPHTPGARANRVPKVSANKPNKGSFGHNY